MEGRTEGDKERIEGRLIRRSILPYSTYTIEIGRWQFYIVPSVCLALFDTFIRTVDLNLARSLTG